MTHPTQAEQGLLPCPYCGEKLIKHNRILDYYYHSHNGCFQQSLGVLSSQSKWWNRRSPHAAASGTETLVDRVRCLEELLSEVADELEAEIKARYALPDGSTFHPAMEPRYFRDMDTVTRARKALGKPHD